MRSPFLALILCGAACTTVPGVGSSSTDERKEIVGLEEMSLEYIQTLWGAPDANTPAGEGRTVRFKGIRTEEEDPITEKVEVKYCDVKLDINKQSLVQSWQYENCRPKTGN